MKKRIKKISRLIMLISVRQVWGLLCNLYLLSYQPFLTLKTIRDKRDKSQFLLVSMVSVLPVTLYVIARISWDCYKYDRVLASVGRVFLITALIEGLIFSYLLYWAGRVIFKNRRDSFVEKA